MFQNKFKAIFAAFLPLLLIVTSFIITANAAAGDYDSSFNAAIYDYPNGKIEEVLFLPDGKVIVAGFFSTQKGKSRLGIARLNFDGTLDNTFNPPAFTPNTNNTAIIRSIAVQADGKILVGGDFQTVGNLFRTGMVRLNTDGSLDNSFNPNWIPETIFTVILIEDIEVQPDGKIVAVGNFDFGQFRRGAVRLNSDGSYDTSFNYSNVNGTLNNVEILPDGKILAGGNSLFRLNSDGTADNTFSASGFGGVTDARIYSLEVDFNGKIVAGGNFTSINGTNWRYLARFNSNGTFDGTFNSNNNGPSSEVRKVLPLSNGKYLIGGMFQTFGGITRLRLALTDSDGIIDPTFNFSSSYDSVFALAERSDGKVWVGGNTNPNIASSEPLRLVNQNGSVDLQGETGYGGKGYKLIVQPDGKILVGGLFKRASGQAAIGLTRFNSDGTIDSAFNQSVITVSDTVFALDLEADGKILVGGSTSLTYYRLNPNGSVFQSVNLGLSNGSILDIKSLPEGKVLVVGGAQCNIFGCNIAYVRKYNQNGTQDASFNIPFTNGVVNKVLVQPDGKIIIIGEFAQVNGINRLRIARLNSDGSLDTSFNVVGGVNNTIYDVALQANGKILIGGLFTSISATSRPYFARVNSNGSLDNTFTPDARSYISAIKVQPDGKILIGGAFSVVNNVTTPGIAKLNPDGTIDQSFNVGLGFFGAPRSIDLQSDGKIVATGEFVAFNGISVAGIARLLNNVNTTPTKTNFDFDGDGRADIGVFRPSNFVWYQLLGSNYNFSATFYGASGDILTPADFNGDGKTDISIFRPSTGQWVYGNEQFVVGWGQTGDIPLPSDVDGDGKADFVVFRPSNRTWYRITNGGGVYTSVEFGAPNDQPVIGDFDGDGKGDPAVFRPSTGEWFYAASSQNGIFLRAAQWGAAGDKLVPADYDGDGKTDAAIYRDGLWAIYNSSNGTNTILTFGQAGDKPVAADYDGDGKADVGVFRPSDGTWYLFRSTSGFQALTFGANADLPIPSAFVQ